MYKLQHGESTPLSPHSSQPHIKFKHIAVDFIRYVTIPSLGKVNGDPD